MAYKWINKVGIAVVEDGKILVVRKRGTDVFILPGGKPEGDESDLETLARELDEELGCSMEHPDLNGVFVDNAAELSDSVVVVRLYTAKLVGDPKPQSEIEELSWTSLDGLCSRPLAPSIKNKIIPYLRKREKSLRKARKRDVGDGHQGLFEIL